MIPSNYYLILAAALFSMGAIGVLIRRNSLVIFMSVELMLNAANLNFIAFWRHGPHPELLAGVQFVIFAIAIAAAEARQAAADHVHRPQDDLCQQHRDDDGQRRDDDRVQQVAAERLAARFAQGYSAVLTGRQALESSGLRDLALVEISD